jgi:hypothetical protein
MALLLCLGLLLPALCLSLPAARHSGTTSTPCCPGEHHTPVPAQNACCKAPATSIAIQTLSPGVELEPSGELAANPRDDVSHAEAFPRVEPDIFFSPPTAVLRI